jgi:hypothetical protein
MLMAEQAGDAFAAFMIEHDERVKETIGKPRMDLVSPHFMEAVGDVLEFGTRKYSPWKWMDGAPYSVWLAALKRHLNRWEKGEAIDPDGFAHLAAVAAHAMFLFEHERLKLGKDDRQHTHIKEPKE